MEISEITRTNILEYLLESPYEQFYGRLELIPFLKRIWDLESLPSTDPRFNNAEADIWQHMINNFDWDEKYLLTEYLNLPFCNDDIFCKFLENCVHPIVVKEEEKIHERVLEFNKELVNDGFKLEATGKISGRHLYKAIKLTNENDLIEKEDVYEVVLSFAGEDRAYVEEVAKLLKEQNIKVFYDKYEEVTLWGKDLVDHLDKVYRGNAKYCVMFISKHYAKKMWTNFERQSALAKAIEEKGEYILPARFDDTKIPGIRPTIGYLSLIDRTPKNLAELIINKIGRLPKTT